MKLDNISYPILFHSSKIFIHPDFDEDLRIILGNSGMMGDFADSLERKLHFIEKDINSGTSPRWLERLKDTDGLYSIKFRMVKNIRVVCMFTDSSKRKIVVLLCGFEEKNKKKGSKDSYNKALQIAKKRRSEIEKGFVIEGAE